MSEWPRIRLGDVTKQVRDAVTVTPGNTYPLLGVRWYAQGPFHRETVTSETSKAKTLYRVTPGQFIYNRLFAWKGSFGLVTPELAGSFVSNEFPLFECDRERILPEYLTYYFGQAALWPKIGQMSTGTTASRNRWKEEEFGSHVLPLPPLAEQCRIVNVMTSVDLQIQRFTDEVECSRQMTTALSIELLQPQPHWESVTIGEVARTATGRAFPDRFQGFSSGILPYFKVSDMSAVGNEREMRVATNWLTGETAGLVKPRVCPAGTVVFPIIGAALLTEKRRVLVRPSAFDQNVMGLIVGDRVTTGFMFAAMSNLRLGDLSQTGAVPSVNQALVSAIRFALPPIAEQIEISKKLSSLYLLTEAAESEVACLQSFRSTLLTALLNQEIEIAESYDDLLEKVF